MEYPKLPEPPAQDDHELAEHYGARLVAWLLGADMITATLDDGQARRAHTAVTVALSQSIMIGCNGDRQATPATVYDQLEVLRRILYATLAGRGLQVQATPTGPPTGPADDPDGGSKVPVTPIVPRFPPTSGRVALPPTGRVHIDF